MHVIAHGPQVWFLLEDAGRLYLEVRCSHSFADYLVLIALDDEETLAFRKGGTSYVDKLADEIQFSGPAVIGSNSPYKSRNLTIANGWEVAAVRAAVADWVAARHEGG